MNEYDAIRRGFKTFPHDEAPRRVKLCRKRLFDSVCGFLLIQNEALCRGYDKFTTNEFLARSKFYDKFMP